MKEKDISCTVEGESTIACVDISKFTQVLHNLLSNSIKYTENTLISPAGMVYKGLEENLKELGYGQSDDSSNDSKSSVKDEAKGCLYSIAGYILNILLLAAIFGLLGAIFG